MGIEEEYEQDRSSRSLFIWYLICVVAVLFIVLIRHL